MLLQLPTELVQLVLQRCTTQAYLQAALSCHSLYNIASSCREVILHHLRINPGKEFQYDQLTTYDLFLLLRRRTAEQLVGANFDMDRTVHTFNDKALDLSACSICRINSIQFMALVFKDDDKVYLCRAEKNGTIRLERTFECLLGVLNVRHLRIVKTVVTPGEHGDVLLAALVRGQDLDLVSKSDTTNVSTSFAKLVEESPLQGSYFLLSFLLGNPPSASGGNVDICRIYEHDDFKVNALAVKDLHEFAISWENMKDDTTHEVIFYKTSPDERDPEDKTIFCVSNLQYKQTKFVDEMGMWLGGDTTMSKHPHFSNLGPVTGLRFNNQDQLLYTHRGGSMFGYYHGFDISATDVFKIEAFEAHQNFCVVQHRDTRFPLSVEIPFFATHETYYDEHGWEVCRWTYLSYGTPNMRSNNTMNTFLLKSQAVCRAARCQHEVDLDRGRRLRNWELVARLRHFPKPTSSLGHIFAISPKGTRIAVFNWDRLYIWPLNPEEVLQGLSSDYYPDALRSKRVGLIDLSPLVIQQGAVCFKLAFITEDTVMALTDRGLRTWDLGPHARKRRNVSNIDVESISTQHTSQ